MEIIRWRSLLLRNVDVRYWAINVLFYAVCATTVRLNIATAFSGFRQRNGNWSWDYWVEFYSIKSVLLVAIQYLRWPNRWHCVVPSRAMEDGWRRSQLLRNFRTWFCLLREVNHLPVLRDNWWHPSFTYAKLCNNVRILCCCTVSPTRGSTQNENWIKGALPYCSVWPQNLPGWQQVLIIIWHRMSSPKYTCNMCF